MKRDGEAAHRAGADEEQRPRRRSQSVTLESMIVAERAVEAGLSIADTGERPEPRLLADALVDQHVRSRPPCRWSARCRRCRAASASRPAPTWRPKIRPTLTSERDVGEQAEQAVDGEHEDDDERRPRSSAPSCRPAIESCAEARADGALLDDRQLGRQRAGAQQDGEVVRLLDGEAARDLARAAGDRRLDDAAPRSPRCRARWRAAGRHSPSSPGRSAGRRGC